jgi:hypothetical protein
MTVESAKSDKDDVVNQENGVDAPAKSRQRILKIDSASARKLSQASVVSR